MYIIVVCHCFSENTFLVIVNLTDEVWSNELLIPGSIASMNLEKKIRENVSTKKRKEGRNNLSIDIIAFRYISARDFRFLIFDLSSQLM